MKYPHRVRLIISLEANAADARASAATADAYAAKQLIRYAESMEQQANTVRNCADYGG